MNKHRNRKESEIDHDLYAFTLYDFPYLGMVGECILHRIVVFNGVSVILFSRDEGDGKTRVQWFAFVKKKWYSDYIITQDNDIDQSVKILSDQAYETIKLL